MAMYSDPLRPSTIPSDPYQVVSDNICRGSPTLRLTEDELIERLRSTIRSVTASKAGVVPFDDYMQHTLFDPELGFYENVRIGPQWNAHFDTFSSLPAFAEMIRGLLPEGCREILEVGGGRGTFLTNLSPLFSGNMYAVDISPSLLKSQFEVSRVHVLAGSATLIPLTNNSFSGAVFCNELLDALPTRVFKVGSENNLPTIKEELFVGASKDNQELCLLWKKVSSRDLFVKHLQTYYRETNRSIPEGTIVSYSPQTKRFINEAERILSPQGRLIMVDYGYKNTPQHDNTPYGKFFVDQNHHQIPLEVLIKFPCVLDVTTMVDFHYVQYLAEKQFGLQSSLTPQACILFPNDLPEGSDEHMQDMYWFSKRFPDQFHVLSIDKP
jgi:SAM-dependent MidA family methyltransferase